MPVDLQVALQLCRAVSVLHTAVFRPADGGVPDCLTVSTGPDLQGWPLLGQNECSAAALSVLKSFTAILCAYCCSPGWAT